MTTANHFSYQAQYREANRERLRQQQRQWRINNPKKVKANSDAYMRRRKGIQPMEVMVMVDRPLEKIELSQEQMDYLIKNKRMDRSKLYKAFKQRFNSSINKLQFNFALIEAKKEKVSKHKSKTKHWYPRPDVEPCQNVYWIAKEGIWNVLFIENGKKHSIGRYLSHVKALQVADEYRQKLA